MSNRKVVIVNPQTPKIRVIPGNPRPQFSQPMESKPQIRRVYVPDEFKGTKNCGCGKKKVDNPRLVCLCPSWRRPRAVMNAYALFLNQTYKNKFLYILNEEGGLKPFRNELVLVETCERFPTLAEKYIYMTERALKLFNPDGIVIWEDDDIYLENHLEQCAIGLTHFDAVHAERVFIFNAGQLSIINTGKSHKHKLYHGTLTFRPYIYTERGYKWDKNVISFDLVFLEKIYENCAVYNTGAVAPPTYIYRWSSPYHWHASTFIVERRYQEASGVVAPVQEDLDLQPIFDEHTLKLLDVLKTVDQNKVMTGGFVKDTKLADCDF